jgi:hypothetical protein
MWCAPSARCLRRNGFHGGSVGSGAAGGAVIGVLVGAAGGRGVSENGRANPGLATGTRGARVMP